jgi:hypothetical protein
MINASNLHLGVCLKQENTFFYVLGYNPHTNEVTFFDTKNLSDRYIKNMDLQGFEIVTKEAFETALDSTAAQIAYTIAIKNQELKECMEMKEILKEGAAHRFKQN